MDPNTQELLMGASGSSVPSDVDFENTVLLLHGDGTNGAQNNTFIDGSTNNFTITRNGNTTQGAFSPFGDRWSNYFDGSGDSISAPSNAAFNLSSDFSIECWVYFSGSSPSGGGVSGELLGASSAGGAVICVRSGTLFALSTNATADDLTASFTFATGTWYHLVACRTGSTACLFINGTRVATGTVTRNYSQSAFVVFSGLNGYISNFRVIKDSNPYGTGSTLSVPTTPLTAILNTSLLTCQSNRFIDNSTNNFTITPNGDVRVEKFNPFGRNAAYDSSIDGGSGYFDGSDYLSIASNAAFNIGSNNACLELWSYSRTTSDVSFGGQNSGPASTLRIIQYAGVYSFTVNDDTIRSTSIPVALNQWVHLALTITGGTVRMFVNGILRYYATGVGSVISRSEPYTIGTEESGAAAFVNGYLCDYRLVNGSIPTSYQTSSSTVGTSIFTPPTAPLTAIANTSLLLNFTNAGVIDNTGLNVLETVGNAQIDTGIKKFGTGSLEFDGSGDYLVTPSSSTFALSSNFTVEGWIYLNALNPLGNASYICDFRIGSINNFTLGVINSSGIGKLYLFVNGVDTTGSGTVSLSQWNHFAYVRIGSTITLYLNGTSSGTMTSSYVQGPTPVVIGARYTGSTEFVNGYIDDLRITNGIARYTANFTPPTAPFPDF